MAELMFGFWRYLSISGREITLWRPYLHHGFVTGRSRSAVDGPMSRLHRLRNRVTHHEPLLTQNLPARRADVLALLGCISPDLQAYVVAQSTWAAVESQRPYAPSVLRLLVDTSTWLDLAKRRDGQKWIVALRLNVQWGNLQLLVPPLVIDEFQRNRPRIESSMTTSVTERFRQIRCDFADYGSETHQEAIKAIDTLAHQVPLIGAMTTRNFDEILALLQAGESLTPTDGQRSRVVQRGLDNRAPFHRQRNSVADALLIEMYASAVAGADLAADPHGFVTSNHDDFSVINGDKRFPHEDLAGTSLRTARATGSAATVSTLQC